MLGSKRREHVCLDISSNAIVSVSLQCSGKYNLDQKLQSSYADTTEPTLLSELWAGNTKGRNCCPLHEKTHARQCLTGAMLKWDTTNR